MEHESKIINRSDIIKNISEHDSFRTKHFINNEYDVKLVRKIITLYLHFMTEALFRGKNWMLPARFGRIQIKKKVYEHPNRMPFFQGHLKNAEAKNKRVANPKTPGLVFNMEIKSEFMDRYKCRFRPAKSIRKRMFNEFYKGELAKKIK